MSNKGGWLKTCGPLESLWISQCRNVVSVLIIEIGGTCTKENHRWPLCHTQFLLLLKEVEELLAAARMPASIGKPDMRPWKEETAPPRFSGGEIYTLNMPPIWFLHLATLFWQIMMLEYVLLANRISVCRIFKTCEYTVWGTFFPHLSESSICFTLPQALSSSRSAPSLHTSFFLPAFRHFATLHTTHT